MRPARLVAPLLAALALAACGGGGAASSPSVPTGTPSSAVVDAPAGATATVNVDGREFDFSGGTCSTVLDANQFVFTTGSGTDTFFNISVLDLKAPVDHGGTFTAAVLYRQDGKDVLNPTDATLKVDQDLSGGTFSGKDFLTGKTVTGSYTC
jgi:hypothetical protein